MEKGFHDIEQFIAFITPGHTAFHERLSIGAYRRGRAREFSSHKDKPPPARTASIELLDVVESFLHNTVTPCPQLCERHTGGLHHPLSFAIWQRNAAALLIIVKL